MTMDLRIGKPLKWETVQYRDNLAKNCSFLKYSLADKRSQAPNTSCADRKSLDRPIFRMKCIIFCVNLLVGGVCCRIQFLSFGRPHIFGAVSKIKPYAISYVYALKNVQIWNSCISKTNVIIGDSWITYLPNVHSPSFPSSLVRGWVRTSIQIAHFNQLCQNSLQFRRERNPTCHLKVGKSRL